MRRFRQHSIICSSLALALACNGGGQSRPDAGGNEPPPDAGARPGEPDAREPAEFDKLELRISPETPLPEHDFSLYIRAADTEGGLFSDYQGVVTVEASDGTLLGAVESQQVTQGTAFLTLRFDESLEDITLTVTDDDDSSMSFTSDPFDVTFEGEPGDEGDVVINEINWYGPLVDPFAGIEDVWVELRNVSGRELNISQWRLEGSGIEGRDVFLFSGTILGPDEYVVVGNLDNVLGIIGGSLLGVPNVQLHGSRVPLELSDEGAQIVLKDVEGTVIDSTPDPAETGGWAAGVADFERGYVESMERRDDITGDGYDNGTDPTEWYTWNRGGGVETTFEDSSDLGTPSEDNSDPNAAVPLPYETSFEFGDPRLELLSSAGEHGHDAPDGTEPRNGDRVITTDSIRSGFNLRRLRTVDCIALDNDTDLLKLSVHAMTSDEIADEENPPEIRLRHVVEWYEDSLCKNRHATAESVQSPATVVDIGEYAEVLFEVDEVPAGATHFLVRLEPRIEQGDGDVDTWAADDLSIEQVSDDSTPDQ